MKISYFHTLCLAGILVSYCYGDSTPQSVHSTILPEATTLGPNNGTTTSSNETTLSPKNHTATTPTPHNTTMFPQTTSPPISNASHLNTYKYSEGKNVTCLIVTMETYFQFPKERINVPKEAYVDKKRSACDRLVVMFGENSFTFFFNSTNTTYHLDEVSADLNKKNYDSGPLKSVDLTMKESYKCKSLTVKLGNITMYATGVQYQAIKVDKNAFGAAKQCKTDLSPIIPIVVGAVLGVLVLIVIIAYLIGRRRSRSGYEEI